VLLAVAVGVVFGRTLGFSFVPYDDPAYITGNGYVAGGVTLRGILWAFTYLDFGAPLAHPGVENLWHPLTWISHMVDAGTFGLALPGGHHFSSVGFHLLGVWAFYFFAVRLTGSRTAALLAALFFAVHPLRVESVAWVSERKDVLSGFFFFGSLALILENRRRVAFWVFVAALMAKPSTVVLPAAAILALGFRDGETRWDWAFWKERLWEWRGWFGAALAVALLAVWLQGRGSHGEAMENLPLAWRLRHLAAGFLLSVWHGFVPVDLTFHYAYPRHPPGISAAAWVMVLALGTALWVRRRANPKLFFAGAWFVVCYLPSSGVFYVGTSLTADRYTYLPLAGAFAMAGLWAVGGRSRLRMAGLAGLLVLFAGLAFRQCGTWRDGWTLFAHAETVEPDNPVVLVNLGAMHQQAGRHDEAMALFRRTLDLAPHDARAWYNLGVSLRETGDADGAIAAFRQAVQVRPGDADAWRNLGLLLADSRGPRRDLAGAREAFLRAVEGTGRRDAIALLLLAKVEFELGDRVATKALLAELEALRPTDPRVERERHELRRMLP
jgi:Tfp pilus assembly protein PilF